MDDREQKLFEKTQPLARMRALADYQCSCSWCCFRAYQCMCEKPDPGRPSQAVAAEMLHQGAALLELVT
jgi:hypothetical protein